MTPQKEKNLGGRPRAYKEEIAQAILDKIAHDCMSLNQISKEEDMPARATINKWIARNEEGFADRYRVAFQCRAYLMAEEIIDISDDGHNDQVMNKNGDMVTNGEAINRSKLKVNTRQWVMSKLIPTFGDKPEATSTDGASKVVVNIVKDDGTTKDA